MSAADQDRQLQLVSEVKRTLAQAEGSVVLVSRSGLDLERFGIRYSHAGVALRDSRNGPWSVRQLYYACDEGQPRLFDQGLAGFLISAGATRTRVSMIVLPQADADKLAAAALDDRLALALLAPRYSANAFAFSTRYQNCNQWVAELMASAWSAQGDAALDREQAQRRLKELGYLPEPVVIPSHALMFAGQFVPRIHVDDHPLEDLYALRMRVSTPVALEAFVRRVSPGAQRVEMCATDGRLIVRRGWAPLDASCQAGDGDEVLALAAP